MHKYYKNWMTIMIQPILFYQKWFKSLGMNDGIGFVISTSAIISVFVTAVVFFKQYLSMGLIFISNISGFKLLFVVPVLAIMAAVFFFMTFMVSVLLIAMTLFAVYCIAGALIYFASKLLGGHGSLADNIKGCMYSSAVSIVLILPFFLIFFPNWVIIMQYNLVVGENVAFYFGTLYLYGLWSIASKNINGIPRWKAFLTAIFPVIFFVLINIVFNLKFLAKISVFLNR